MIFVIFLSINFSFSVAIVNDLCVVEHSRCLCINAIAYYTLANIFLCSFSINYLGVSSYEIIDPGIKTVLSSIFFTCYHLTSNTYVCYHLSNRDG